MNDNKNKIDPKDGKEMIYVRSHTRQVGGKLVQVQEYIKHGNNGQSITMFEEVGQNLNGGEVFNDSLKNQLEDKKIVLKDGRTTDKFRDFQREQMKNKEDIVRSGQAEYWKTVAEFRKVRAILNYGQPVKCHNCKSDKLSLATTPREWKLEGVISNHFRCGRCGKTTCVYSLTPGAYAKAVNDGSFEQIRNFAKQKEAEMNAKIQAEVKTAQVDIANAAFSSTEPKVEASGITGVNPLNEANRFGWEVGQHKVPVQLKAYVLSMIIDGKNWEDIRRYLGLGTQPAAYAWVNRNLNKEAANQVVRKNAVQEVPFSAPELSAEEKQLEEALSLIASKKANSTEPVKPKNFKWTPENIESIKNEIKAGKSLREIGESRGITESGVSVGLRRVKISVRELKRNLKATAPVVATPKPLVSAPRGRKTEWTTERYEEVRAKIRSGQSFAEVAKEYGVQEISLKARLSNYGKKLADQAKSQGSQVSKPTPVITTKEDHRYDAVISSNHAELHGLSEHSDKFVRLAVIGNLNTSLSTLAEMALGDKDEEVKTKALKMYNTRKSMGK